jgi:hypothetical protein
MDFSAFLRLMHQNFPELEYSREAQHYARFYFRNQNPADPQPPIFPIIAREEGTVVGYEEITALLGYFSLDIQKFRDGYNAYYELSPPPLASGAVVAEPSSE